VKAIAKITLKMSTLLFCLTDMMQMSEILE